MPKLDRSEIERLIELSSKATQGEWTIDPDDRDGMAWNNHIVSAADPNFAISFMSHSGTSDNTECQANAELLVGVVNFFRSSLPALRELEQDARRYVGLVELMKARNVDLRYYERTHEIDGPTWALCDHETGSTLSYGPTVDAAIDAKLRGGES